MIGDPDSTMGDHRVSTTGVTSHDDEVIDRRPDVGLHWCRADVDAGKLVGDG
jgi:hypothetical protein